MVFLFPPLPAIFMVPGTKQLSNCDKPTEIFVLRMRILDSEPMSPYIPRIIILSGGQYIPSWGYETGPFIIKIVEIIPDKISNILGNFIRVG